MDTDTDTDLVVVGFTGLGTALAESLGVRIAEHTPATDVVRRGGSVRVRTPSGLVRTGQVVLGVLATEPLSPEHLAAVGCSRAL